MRNGRSKIPKTWELVVCEYVSVRKTVKMVLIWAMKRVDGPLIINR